MRETDELFAKVTPFPQGTPFFYFLSIFTNLLRYKCYTINLTYLQSTSWQVSPCESLTHGTTATIKIETQQCLWRHPWPVPLSHPTYVSPCIELMSHPSRGAPLSPEAMSGGKSSSAGFAQETAQVQAFLSSSMCWLPRWLRSHCGRWWSPQQPGSLSGCVEQYTPHC
jgi:hypothetical protein